MINYEIDFSSRPVFFVYDCDQWLLLKLLVAAEAMVFVGAVITEMYWFVRIASLPIPALLVQLAKKYMWYLWEFHGPDYSESEVTCMN